MSIADLSVPGNFPSPHLPAGQHEIISLNELLAHALKKTMDAAGVNLIVRCEPLPLMYGDPRQMHVFFDILASLVVKCFATCYRGFLLVKCEEWNIPAGVAPGNPNKNYLLSFHTNLSEGFVKKALNNEMIDQCQQIISSHDGSFIVNNNHAGCLFSIILPGKLQ